MHKIDIDFFGYCKGGVALIFISGRDLANLRHRRNIRPFALTVGTSQGGTLILGPETPSFINSE